MIKKGLFIFTIIVIQLFRVYYTFGQVTSELITIRTSHGSVATIDQIVIKGNNKTYAFEMDTSSMDYKSLSKVEPNWIKKIEIIKDKLINGEAKTFVIITLRKRKFRFLPEEIRNRFIE